MPFVTEFSSNSPTFSPFFLMTHWWKRKTFLTKLCSNGNLKKFLLSTLFQSSTFCPKKWKFKLGWLIFCRLGWAEFHRYQNSKFNFDRLHFLVKNWTFKRVCFCAAVLSKSPFQSVKLTLNHFLESFKLCNLDHREVPAFCAWVKLQSDF